MPRINGDPEPEDYYAGPEEQPQANAKPAAQLIRFGKHFDLTQIYRRTPRVLYLLRGVPGAGKTVLAQILEFTYRKWGISCIHFEVDQFLVNPETGEYDESLERLGDAHEACQKSVEEALEQFQTVVVSNPFISRAHLEPYLRMAKKTEHIPVEIICRGSFPNVHGITPEKVRKMKQNFEVSS